MVRLQYIYDNSASNPRNPHSPPERVVYGPNSRDEMAEFFLQLTVDDPAAIERTRAVFVRKDSEDMIRGWRHLVALDSTDAWAQLGLGIVAHESGKLDEAERRYGIAIAAQPDYPRAYHRLALLHELRGDVPAALAAYQRAISGPVDNLPALNDYGRLLASNGDAAGAVALLERVVATNPTNAEARNNLGGALVELGRIDDALPHLERAVALNPQLAQARFNLAFALIRLRRTDDGLRSLNAGLSLDGGNVQPALTVAWTLATHPDPNVRRPALAVDLADQIRGVTGPHPVTSDVLAAALAASGRFADAQRFIDEAISEARRRDQTQLVRDLEARASLYRSGRPYLEASAAGGR